MGPCTWTYAGKDFLHAVPWGSCERALIPSAVARLCVLKTLALWVMLRSFCRFRWAWSPETLSLLLLRSRPGKYPGAVTFPIRCGRALPGPQPSYQLPIMALLADFGSSHPDRICLSYRDLRTLLHELGHCCHNLASRTRYQVWEGRWDLDPLPCRPAPVCLFAATGNLNRPTS